MEGAAVEAYGDEVAGLFWLPAELWAMVCGYLGTGDLARLSTTCWTLRSLALSRVRHHTFTPLGTPTSHLLRSPLLQVNRKINSFIILMDRAHFVHDRPGHWPEEHAAGVDVRLELAGPRVARPLRLGLLF
jgi:hypothetical protein